jgi:pimeloyl-ACP methyl ester carboxylesterase
VRGIAATGKAADVRVLQYGVTCARLRAVLEEAEGWDIIHVSGHGWPGSLTLETAAGSPDPDTHRHGVEAIGLDSGMNVGSP